MISDISLKYAKEEHFCPHCDTRLSCTKTPPMHVGDGLGWGTDVFFICLNNECSLYKNGWEYIEQQYGKIASYRYMLLPGEKKGSPMMVGSPAAFTGAEIDVKQAEKKNVRYQKEKQAVKDLETCVEEKNLAPIICLITDEQANLKDRHRACELLEKVNDLNCIDPIRNHNFIHKELEQLSNIAISKILKKQFKKECPHCAEIIKCQAKICKNCGK